jgi:hypothetical protein
MRCDTDQVACPSLPSPQGSTCPVSPLGLSSPESKARPAERLLALHLHQRAHLRHITIWTYYREGSIPAVPRHWLRLFASASAVISIRQGCNNFDANLQQRCARGRLVLSSYLLQSRTLKQHKRLCVSSLRVRGGTGHWTFQHSAPSQSAYGAQVV